MRLWLVGACVPMFALACDAAAQTSVHDSTTTKAGVYSREQAARGQDVYANSCRSCHTPETHAGAAFEKWNDRPLSDLYAFIRDAMPRNAPGSLSAQEYADVLAYLLRMNRMPAGSRELSVDSIPMKTIRISTRKLSVRKDP